MRQDLTEDQEEEYKVLHAVGYMSVAHFLEHKLNAQNGLLLFGDDFQKSLGTALLHADRANAIKIMRVWAKECEEYAMLKKIWIAKQKALNEEAAKGK